MKYVKVEIDDNTHKILKVRGVYEGKPLKEVIVGILTAEARETQKRLHEHLMEAELKRQKTRKKSKK